MVNIGFEPKIATFLNSFLVFVYMISVPIFGYLTDKFGERKILAAGSIAMILFAFPFLYTLKTGGFASIAIASAVAGIIIGMFQSAVPSFSAKAFPISVRASGVSLGYNLPAIIFGGTAPMIVTYIMNASAGDVIPVGYYLIFGSACAAASTILSGKFLKYQ
jgi:MFS family permease